MKLFGEDIKTFYWISAIVCDVQTPLLSMISTVGKAKHKERYKKEKKTEGRIE